MPQNVWVPAAYGVGLTVFLIADAANDYPVMRRLGRAIDALMKSRDKAPRTPIIGELRLIDVKASVIG